MASNNPDYKLRGEPKKQFNKIRGILLRNIPPSTEGEIEEFLGRFKAEKIEISESLDSAIVTLKNGRQLEEAVRQLDNNKLKDNDVTVTFCASDKLICVAHLPPRYSDEEMLKMMEEHGDLKTCFIMRSEKTGHSKSYALLEFEEQDTEKVRKIRDEIDWKEVGSHLLHADFIEPTYQTWERLQSRCLAVSGLPKDFSETNKLREMFSVVTSPVYCQIVMLEKESLGMGIVEFRKPEEAEETWEKTREEKIEDKEITVTFCIPSKSAVFINNRIMWKFSDKMQKSSLLPDPVSAKPVISNNAVVLSLMKQNPSLIEDFTKVLAEFHQAYVNHMMSPGNKPGLLGPAPTLPMSPMMNPHLQMGLLIMLVLHIHAEKKEPFTGLLAKQLNSLAESPPANQSTDSGKKPSILGDPMTAQANIVLANLKKQLNQVPVTEEDKRVVTSSSPEVRAVLAKFMQNARFLNLNLLVNLGQMVMNMHASCQQVGPMAQGGAPAGSVLGRPAGGTSLLNPPGSGKGLLGDVPYPKSNPATMRFMKTLEAVASQKIGGQNRGLLSAIMTNINVNPAIGKLEKKTSLLGEPPQHLKQPKDGMGGPGGRNMGPGNMMGMGGMGNMDGMGGGMGNMGGGMGNMGGGMGNMGGGMGNMGGGMGNMGGGMGNMGGGMGNMGGGMGNMGGGMGNMGGGMGNTGGGMGNMGGGMGNMGGGMGNMGGGMGNMGGGMGGNMGGGMGGNMGGGMGGNMGGGMSDMSGMGQQSGNKQSWGSGVGQAGMGRGAGGNTNTGNKADSYSTFGNYSGGYGDMSGYGSGYTEEYSQFNQGDYNSGGYGDTSMYGGDQSGYQYSDYSGNYNTGQDTYNFQGTNNYSGNFGDYTGGYSGSNTGNTGFNQSGNVQDGNRFGGGGGGGSWGGPGGTNANSSGGMGSGVRNNMGMSKNFSGGGAGPGGGSGMGQGAGDGFGSSTTSQGGYGGGNTAAGRQGLLGAGGAGRGSGTSGNMGGNFGNQGTGNMGRTNTSAESYQTSTNQGYMSSGNNMGGSSNMGSYSGYGNNEMEGYNSGNYNDASGTEGYGSYSMGDYNSYNQGGYGNTDNMASYSTAGGNTTGMMNTSNQLTPAGSKRGYGDYSGQQQQGVGGQYDKRPRLY